MRDGVLVVNFSAFAVIVVFRACAVLRLVVLLYDTHAKVAAVVQLLFGVVGRMSLFRTLERAVKLGQFLFGHGDNFDSFGDDTHRCSG